MFMRNTCHQRTAYHDGEGGVLTQAKRRRTKTSTPTENRGRKESHSITLRKTPVTWGSVIRSVV